MQIDDPKLIFSLIMLDLHTATNRSDFWHNSIKHTISKLIQKRPYYCCFLAHFLSFFFSIFFLSFSFFMAFLLLLFYFYLLFRSFNFLWPFFCYCLFNLNLLFSWIIWPPPPHPSLSLIVRIYPQRCVYLLFYLRPDSTYSVTLMLLHFLLYW